MVELARDQLLNYWLRIDSQNSMSVPLELRTPYLDYRVVEFAFSLPVELLIRDGWMKWLLRKAMEDVLPSEVVWRRKKGGFPFPLGPWLVRHEARILAMLAGLDGDFERAAQLYGETGVLLFEAEARLRFADQLSSAGRGAEAASELGKALAFYRPLGAVLFVERGERLLAEAAMG